MYLALAPARGARTAGLVELWLVLHGTVEVYP